MSAPNEDDPLDEAVADHWKNDPDGAIKKAKEWTQQYANNWADVSCCRCNQVTCWTRSGGLRQKRIFFDSKQELERLFH